MYVPNYMPEPIEVPGNVTTERYAIRLVFIRRVIWLHLMSLTLIGMAMTAPFLHRGVVPAATTLVCFLIVLDIVRIHTRGRREEPWLSCAFFVPVIFMIAELLRELYSIHFPVWAFFVGPPTVAIYSLVCGRDFSFVGAFFLSLIASSLIVAGTALSLHLSGTLATYALTANAIYLFYWVYDLAALMARRRLGEEPAAVVDLYRDVFNIFGYLPRVIAHWKKHHIWAVPTPSHKHRDD